MLQSAKSNSVDRVELLELTTLQPVLANPDWKSQEGNKSFDPSILFENPQSQMDLIINGSLYSWISKMWYPPPDFIEKYCMNGKIFLNISTHDSQ